MELKLIQIGNSKGIRLPKAVLDEIGNFTVADLQIQKGTLVITPKQEPRQSWEEGFKDFGIDPQEKDELLMDFANEFDDKEWTW